MHINYDKLLTIKCLRLIHQALINKYCIWYNKDGNINRASYFINGIELAEYLDQQNIFDSLTSPDEISKYINGCLKIHPFSDNQYGHLFYSISYYLYLKDRYLDAMKFIYKSTDYLRQSLQPDQFSIYLDNRVNPAINELFFENIELFEPTKYKEIAPIIDSIIPIIREIFGKSDTSVLTKVLSKTGKFYCDIGRFEKAEHLYQEILRIDKEIYSQVHPVYNKDLNELALLYFDMGKYEQAESLLIESIGITKKTLGKDHYSYGTKLHNLGLLYTDLAKYEQAMELMIESLRISKKVYGKNHPSYASSLLGMGQIYAGMGQYNQAENLMIEAAEIAKDNFGDNHSSYSPFIHSLALLYYDMGKYKNAEPLMLKAKEIDENLLGLNHPTYSSRLNNLAILYQAMGQYEKVESLLVESSRIIKEAFGTHHPDYATVLNNLGQFYNDVGKFNKAESFMIEEIQIDKDIFGKNHPSYVVSLNNLGTLYISLGKYNQAEILLVEALQIAEDALGQSHPSYLRGLNSLGYLYLQMGQYELAEPLLIEAKIKSNESLGKHHNLYVTAINNLAQLYVTMGRYEQAEPIMINVIQITKETIGDTHPSYAERMNNLALIYLLMKQYKKAEPLYVKSLKILKENFGENHPTYGLISNNLAMLYHALGKYEHAEPLLIEVIGIDKENYALSHPNYGRHLNNLAVLYRDMRKYEQAERLFIEVIQIQKEALGDNHPEYCLALNNLAQVYDNLDRIKEVEHLITEAFYALKSHLKTNSGYLSEKEFQLSIKTFLFYLENYQSFNYRSNNTTTTPGPFALDIELLRKGILLQSVLQTRRSILESSDTNLISFYREMIALRKRADRVYNKPIEERYVDPDSLSKKANDIEKKLTLQSKEYRKSVEEIDITWEQVKDNLAPGEASIEISNFHYYDKGWTDSVLYCAIVLRNDIEKPKMIYLFEEQQLTSLLPSISGVEEGILKVYSLAHEESRANKTYDLIWAPLEPYLDSVKKLNISTSGELNRLAFNALTDENGDLLCNKYNLVQLTSTREIAFSRPDKSIESVAVFGGIDYSLDTTEMLALAQDISTDGLPRGVYRGDSTARGLALTYLPGTMEEAKEIEKECNTSGKKVDIFSGKLATEENFRLLEENGSPDIIHIATHGFYFPEEKTREHEERMRFMQTEQENQFIYSPDPLMRSGLALSGANHAWQGEKLPRGVEDGILTARDVSRLNLMNTELVVLSACQTGLGDVKGSEGVYGLQRAFKMAGVRYLLMSLWKVPDKSTKEFMVTFYKKLLSGESIRESYQTTQQVMSNKYPDDPFKWAAFVLVE